MKPPSEYRDYPWTRTLDLRQVQRWVGDHPVVFVQQKWRHVTSGETEWRDVPIVEEAHDAR